MKKKKKSVQRVSSLAERHSDIELREVKKMNNNNEAKGMKETMNNIGIMEELINISIAADPDNDPDLDDQRLMELLEKAEDLFKLHFGNFKRDLKKIDPRFVVKMLDSY